MISAFMNTSVLCDSAHYLYDFLDYFGNKFNFKTTVIAPINNTDMMGFFSNPNMTSSITIYDPLNTTNNISQSSFKYDEIQEGFKKSFEKINRVRGEFKNLNLCKSILEEIYKED